MLFGPKTQDIESQDMDFLKIESERYSGLALQL